MADIKAAIRSLTKSPGFSTVAILTIAVGIAANTALFSVYDRLVLNPVTIPQSSTLVAVLEYQPATRRARAGRLVAALRRSARSGDVVLVGRLERLR